MLGTRGVDVMGVYAGPTDTDMTRGFPLEKVTPQQLAKGVLDGIESGQEDIFPDPYAVAFGAQYLASPKESERQMAAMMAAAPSA